MSTQSVIHNTDEKIAMQVNSFLKEAGIKYLLNKRFSVGEGVCMSDIRRICRLTKVFCEDSCKLSKEDFDKIKERINTILIFNIPEL